MVIGLTGGIATGKSTVTGILRRWEVPVVDADKIAREITAPGQPALKEIRKEFGAAVFRPDGSLDRQKLGDVVFRDTAARRRLEAITHPRIRKRMAEEIAAWASRGADVVVCDIPLLFESGEPVLRMVDRVAVVYVDPEEQIRRLMERDGLTAEEALRRVAAQLPIDEKVRRADDVIDNRCDLQGLEKRLAELWEEWRELAHRVDRPR